MENKFVKEYFGSLNIKIESGGRPKGGTLKVKEGIPSIGAEHLVMGGGFDFNSIKYVPKSYFDKAKRGKIREGDILVVKDGATIGKVSLVTSSFPFKDAMVNEHVFILRSEDENIDQKYLYYRLITHEGIETIKGSISGSAQGGLKKDFLDNWLLDLPPLPTQKRIAAILSAFDGKIELNNKINDTLEQMAQAVFKEWFVKFRFPASAKATAGKPGHEKAKFVDSEMGRIPEGWEVVTFGDLVADDFAGDWGKEKPTGDYYERVSIIRGTDIPAVKKGGVGECPIRYIKKKALEKKALKVGDILFEISGGSAGQSTGRSVYITENLLNRFDAPVVGASFCRTIRVRNSVNPTLVFLHLERLYKEDVMFNYQVQSTGISNFQYTYFKESDTLVVPPTGIAGKVSAFFGSYLDRSSLNENVILSSLRDLLLPKLMKGEIKVRKI